MLVKIAGITISRILIYRRYICQQLRSDYFLFSILIRGTVSLVTITGDFMDSIYERINLELVAIELSIKLSLGSGITYNPVIVHRFRVTTISLVRFETVTVIWFITIHRY